MYGPKSSGRSRHGAPERKHPEDAIEDTPVVDPWQTARLVRQHRIDGCPRIFSLPTIGSKVAFGAKRACE
jgi:hypothetical protein